MIDSASETLISLTDAARSLPRRRRGRKTHVSTVYRWTVSGVHGITLEWLQCGGTRCTSREAMQRFFEALSRRQAGPVGGGRAKPSVGRRTIAQRNRASAEAGRKLAEKGA
jgi:hypothetical protein